MEVWRDPSEVAPDAGPYAVAIGTFDGVHRGHQVVLQHTLDASVDGARPAVITFHPHPMTVVRPDAAPPALATLERRLTLLDELGIDATLVVPFTAERSHQSAEDFVTEVVVGAMRASTVVVGHGFRFGHRAAGDVDLLRRMGAVHRFTVVEVPLESDGAEEPVSSSRVRAAVAAGDVRAAWTLLGRPHVVEGEVVRGDQRGRLLGYPTANLADPAGYVVPPDGIYAGWLVRADRTRLPAAISVGTNPTFGEHSRRVEAYVLDRDDLELYGEHVAIEFGWHLRGMITFDGIDPLLAQMADDCERTRTLTQSNRGSGETT